MKRLLLAALATCATSAVHAQAVTAYSPEPTARECSAAADALTAGRLDGVDSQWVALSTVVRCPALRASALARTLELYRTDTLSAALRNVFWAAAQTGATIPTLERIAADTSASVAARVLSVQTLMVFIDPSIDASHPQLVATPAEVTCLPPSLTDSGQRPTDLPANFLEQIPEVLGPLEQSATGPHELRSSANCAMNAWRRKQHLPLRRLSTAAVGRDSIVRSSEIRSCAPFQSAEAPPASYRDTIRAGVGRSVICYT